MRSSFAPILIWAYWANIIYIIGMKGYLTIDTITYMFTTINATLSCTVYLILAVVFVIDALLYTIDWYIYAVKLRKNPDEPIEYRCEFASCLFQNLGSYFYLIGAALSFKPSRSLDIILLFNFLGILAFLTESVLTLIGWLVFLRKKSSDSAKHGCHLQNIYLWAHTMNILANLIYFHSIILAFLSIGNSNSARLHWSLILRIVGDLVYLLDAYLYHACWRQDQQAYNANTERENLIKISLQKLVLGNKTKTTE